MHIRGDHAELVVGGRLDVRSAADARTVLHSAVDDGVGDLVLDLSELDSWDATGLGVIMGAHRRAAAAGAWCCATCRRRCSACWWPPGCTASWRSRGHRGGHAAPRVGAYGCTTDEPEKPGPRPRTPRRAHNPHETVTSRTPWYPGLSWILTEGLGFGCPLPCNPRAGPDQKRQRGVQRGRGGLQPRRFWGLGPMDPNHTGPEEYGHGGDAPRQRPPRESSPPTSDSTRPCPLARCSSSPGTSC